MTDKDYPTIGEIRTVEDLPLIVYPTTGTVTRVTVEAQTCRTCSLWWAGRNNRGECFLPWERGMSIVLQVTGDGGASLITPADWYCKGYQQRGGE